MLFGMINDLHLTEHNPISRVDDVEEASLSKLTYVYQYLRSASKERREDCILLIGGDMFDSPRSWWLLPKVAQIINRFQIKTYVVVGQHDSYYYDEKSILHTNIGLLDLLSPYLHILPDSKTKKIRILEDGQAVANLYGVWFTNKWMDRVDEAVEKLPKNKEKGVTNILVIHAPVAKSEDYRFGFPAEKLFEQARRFDIILVGDIHISFMLKEKRSLFRWRYMINTGPMMRLDNTDEMEKHSPHFYVYSTNGRHLWQAEIPHRPFVHVFSKSFVPPKAHDMEKDAINELVDSLRNKMDSEYKDPVKIIRELAGQLGQRVRNRQMARMLKQILEEAGL